MAKINIGFIGIGSVSKIMVDSIKQTNAEYSLIAGYDLDENKKENLPKEAQFYSNLNDFLKNPQIDTVYISTYNEHHYPMAKKSLQAGKKVILEKPATINMTELEDLIKISREKNKLLYVAFHAAHGIELLEFLKLYEKGSKLQNSLGEIKGFRSEFFDPYISKGELLKRRGEYDGSWVDSGINALSVVGIIPEITNLEFLKLNLTKVPDYDRREISGIGYYKFKTVRGNNGFGTIDTNWTLGLNSKKTTLYFNNAEIVLDHSNEEIRLLKDNSDQLIFKNNNGLSRLVNHYIGVLDDYNTHWKENKDNLDHAYFLQKLHEGKK